jgi:hypothetical protein
MKSDFHRLFCGISILTFCLLAQTALCGSVKQGDKVTIVTPDTIARLCPYPMCGSGEHLTRIPEGTSLKVIGINNVKSGMMGVTWFEVEYKKKKGWISIYDTDKQ